MCVCYDFEDRLEKMTGENLEKAKSVWLFLARHLSLFCQYMVSTGTGKVVWLLFGTTSAEEKKVAVKAWQI